MECSYSSLPLLFSLRGCLQTRATLHAENLALRHQLLLLQRVHQNRRLRLRSCDRLVWVWLSRVWSNWRSALRIVKPETVIAWHRQGFRMYWKWKSRVRHDFQPGFRRRALVPPRGRDHFRIPLPGCSAFAHSRAVPPLVGTSESSPLVGFTTCRKVSGFRRARLGVQISETIVTYRVLWHQIQVRGGVCLLTRLISFHRSMKLRNHPTPLCYSRVQLS